MKGAPQNDSRVLLRDRIMRPLGVPDADWSVGYGKTFSVDGLPLVPAWGGGNFTPRAVARIGRLVLRGGDWDGRRILSEEAVRQVTGDAGLPGHCGMGWWTNADGRYPDLPRDAGAGRAMGRGDQILFSSSRASGSSWSCNGQELRTRPPDRRRTDAGSTTSAPKILLAPLIKGPSTPGRPTRPRRPPALPAR